MCQAMITKGSVIKLDSAFKLWPAHLINWTNVYTEIYIIIIIGRSVDNEL